MNQMLLKNLKKVIKSNRSGLIVCTIFASNISRIITLSLAAKSAGRKVGVIGRSLYRIIKVLITIYYIYNLTRNNIHPLRHSGKQT